MLNQSDEVWYWNKQNLVPVLFKWRFTVILQSRQAFSIFEFIFGRSEAALLHVSTINIYKSGHYVCEQSIVPRQ
jgi:hypothetical protein